MSYTISININKHMTRAICNHPPHNTTLLRPFTQQPSSGKNGNAQDRQSDTKMERKWRVLWGCSWVVFQIAQCGCVHLWCGRLVRTCLPGSLFCDPHQESHNPSHTHTHTHTFIIPHNSQPCKYLAINHRSTNNCAETLKPRLHDTAGCQTGCTTSCIV